MKDESIRQDVTRIHEGLLAESEYRVVMDQIKPYMAVSDEWRDGQRMLFCLIATALTKKVVSENPEMLELFRSEMQKVMNGDYLFKRPN